MINTHKIKLNYIRHIRTVGIMCLLFLIQMVTPAYAFKYYNNIYDDQSIQIYEVLVNKGCFL